MKITSAYISKDDPVVTLFCVSVYLVRPSQVALVIKNPAANAGDERDAGLSLGSGRSPGERNGNLL